MWGMWERRGGVWSDMVMKKYWTTSGLSLMGLTRLTCEE